MLLMLAPHTHIHTHIHTHMHSRAGGARGRVLTPVRWGLLALGAPPLGPAAADAVVARTARAGHRGGGRGGKAGGAVSGQGALAGGSGGETAGQQGKRVRPLPAHGL